MNVVAKRLGDNVEQILKTYGHFFPDEQAEIIEKFNDIELNVDENLTK